MRAQARPQQTAPTGSYAHERPHRGHTEAICTKIADTHLGRSLLRGINVHGPRPILAPLTLIADGRQRNAQRGGGAGVRHHHAGSVGRPSVHLCHSGKNKTQGSPQMKGPDSVTPQRQNIMLSVAMESPGMPLPATNCTPDSHGTVSRHHQPSAAPRIHPRHTGRAELTPCGRCGGRRNPQRFRLPRCRCPAVGSPGAEGQGAATRSSGRQQKRHMDTRSRQIHRTSAKTCVRDRVRAANTH
jgi:hypothetical protein